MGRQSIFGIGMKRDRKVNEVGYNMLAILVVIIYNILPIDLNDEPYYIIFIALFTASSIQVKLSYMPVLLILWALNYFYVDFREFILVYAYFILTYSLRLWSFRIYQKDLVLAAGRGFVSDFSRGKVQLSWIDVLYTVLASTTIFLTIKT